MEYESYQASKIYFIPEMNEFTDEKKKNPYIQYLNTFTS
jgi:hypothetical protein